MCTTHNGKGYDRPYHNDDITLLRQHFADIDNLDEIIAALLDHSHPKIGVMVIVAHMMQRFKRSEFRTGTRMVTLPFSAQEFGTLTRYQSSAMGYVHDLMLSFALSTRNIALLNTQLEKLGMRLSFFCDCGCAMHASDEDIGASEVYLSTNLFRAYGESEGTPVLHTDTFEDIMGMTDMTHLDWNAHEYIYRVIGKFPRRNTTFPNAVIAAREKVRRQTALDLVQYALHHHGTFNVHVDLHHLIPEVLVDESLCKRHRRFCVIDFDPKIGTLVTSPASLIAA